MKPIRMLPAYRHGDMTPWGGDGLKRYYGRNIPDDRTGESLEISALPHLESYTPEGETLPQLIEKYGDRLTGADFRNPFPLLLKLICSKSSLSVQVHPGDEYAWLHEGKAGKTEAWVILQAQEGAEMLYGLKEGVTKAELEHSLRNGENVEELIHHVPVREGDVLYMPSGMVHAIGGGILLYEIQQSSDVTYRLWDFNRTDSAGKKRPLHIQRSLDVIRPELRGNINHFPKEGEEGCFSLVLSPAFELQGIRVRGMRALPQQRNSFAILTALEPLSLVSSSGESFSLAQAESVLLPAEREALVLHGRGRALYCEPLSKVTLEEHHS